MQPARPQKFRSGHFLTLPPSFIQLERDSGFEFCPVGRIVQRRLARSWLWGAASDPFAGRRYAYVKGVPVIVERKQRQIVYIVR